MACVFEILATHKYDIDVKIIPGITALNSAGSLLGVPFMNDFCSISLSDRLTPVDIIMGYAKYIELIEEFIENRNVVPGSVTDELERANRAINYVMQGKNVSIISSGDSGIYGMAGIVFEILAAHKYDIDVKIIPGITALNSAGSLLGVPFTPILILYRPK